VDGQSSWDQAPEFDRGADLNVAVRAPADATTVWSVIALHHSDWWPDLVSEGLPTNAVWRFTKNPTTSQSEITVSIFVHAVNSRSSWVVVWENGHVQSSIRREHEEQWENELALLSEFLKRAGPAPD